jgi:hypothetical protein
MKFMKEKNGLQFFRHLPVAMLLLISVPLFSQQKDFHYYDSLTIPLYQQKEWKSLLNLGREALNQGYRLLLSADEDGDSVV